MRDIVYALQTGDPVRAEVECRERLHAQPDDEDLIAAPDQHLANLAAWIGIDFMYRNALPKPPGSIATASLWQARQPIYTSALGRWRSYLGCIHELERFAE